MLQIRHYYCILDELVKAIAFMYNNSSTFVDSADIPTKDFFKTAGILQNQTFATYLFLIVVNYLFQ